jgi:hypothetical protein
VCCPLRLAQARGEVQPNSSTGHRQQMLHEAGHPREDDQPSIGQELRGCAELPEDLALEPLGGQHKGKRLDVLERGPEVYPRGGAHEPADHVRCGRGHLLGVPPDVGGIGYVRVEVARDGALQPGADTLALHQGGCLQEEQGSANTSTLPCVPDDPTSWRHICAPAYQEGRDSRSSLG